MSNKAARFLFNAGVGVAMIVAGSLFLLLGIVGILSIVAFPQGIGLVFCAGILYLCGSRLVIGALLGE